MYLNADIAFQTSSENPLSMIDAKHTVDHDFNFFFEIRAFKRLRFIIKTIWKYRLCALLLFFGLQIQFKT